MLTEERHERILNCLVTDQMVKLIDLVEALDVSESTIRRDLTQLEEQGKLVRVHGGARITYQLSKEIALSEKEQAHHEDKKAIAQLACTLVSDHDVIYLDAGTSTQQMIPYLAGRSVHVVTNGVQHAQQLTQLGIETTLIGGHVRASTLAVVGIAAQEQMRRYRFDRVFLGMNGVDPFYGWTTPNEEEGAIKRFALHQGDARYVLVDPSKFGQVSFCQVAPLSDAVILTTKLTNDQRELYGKSTTIKEVE
ncbi:DeoR/GlpR family DNA-binding transcription regulator [Atopobacter phocae]|uniref:DeoR/GlpR family DNA-binding transcription regulator n=1 Tax=Atopobacter phocae TaxID=136492 RepID=UPI00046FD731|nr:DeoR/GlpR family DNA-binding transcription regulator [Atopobacter phocae]